MVVVGYIFASVIAFALLAVFIKACYIAFVKIRKKIRPDASDLTRIATRHCQVLTRSNPAQRKLRSQIKKLCKSRWNKNIHYKLKVIDVGVVTNAALRQHYERAYQAEQSAVKPVTLTPEKMARSQSNHDNKDTVSVSLEAAFDLEDLRPGEKRLFYFTRKSEVKAVLKSDKEPAFSGIKYCSMTKQNYISLGEFFTYFCQAPDYCTKYMFVVRAIIGAETVIHGV